jgi:undecaprenyl-diphosphatase
MHLLGRLQHLHWARFVRAEIASLAVLFLLAFSLFAFAEISDEVGDGETLTFDRAVLTALRDGAGEPVGPRALQVALADLTSLGSSSVLTLVVLATVGFLFLARRRHSAIYVLVASVGGGLLSIALKSLFDRPRPDVVVHLVNVSSASFPSGHALGAAAIYLTLAALLARELPRRRLRAFAVSAATVVVVIIGASRMYLGVHWPTDVLAGWCVGAAWAMLCWLIADRLGRRQNRASPPPSETTSET